MTMQINSTMVYNGDDYNILYCSSRLPSPETYGIWLGEFYDIIRTDCQEGYYAEYELKDDVLYLRELTIYQKNIDYPPIGGILPKIEGGEATYSNLNEVVDFTGKLTLGRKLLDDFCRDSSYNFMVLPPMFYGTVVELTFVDGRVVGAVDRSHDAEEERALYLKTGSHPFFDEFEETE